MQRASFTVLLLVLEFGGDVSLGLRTSGSTYGVNSCPLPTTPVPPTISANSRNGSTAGSSCTLYPVYPVQEQLQRLLLSKAKLIEIGVSLVNEPPGYLRDRLPGYHNPSLWVRSMGRQGRSLLILEDSYQFMSLSFLSLGVYTINVTLADSPAHCLMVLTPEEVLSAMRRLMLSDFKEAAGASFGVDDHICNIRVKDDGGYAEFVYVCCHKGPDGEVICKDTKRDVWIEILMIIIAISKVIVVLYSPSFIPGSLYRLKYVASEYVFRPARELHMRFIVTQTPSIYGHEDKVVRLSTTSDMEYFKTLVGTQTKTDRVYQLTLSRAHLRIKARRMLGENDVPVGLCRLLYNNFLRCRIRRLSPIEDCCDTPLLGSLTPRVRVIKWYKCGRIFAKSLVVLVLLLPWFVRLWVFYRYEHHTAGAKKETAGRLGLKTHFQSNFTLYLTPLHALFIFIYLIFVVDAVLYGVISKAMKKKFKHLLRKCLRDMRERSRLEVCGWTLSLLVLPFRKLGVLGLLFFPPYVVVVLPATLPVLAFYLFPAINFSARLLIHVVFFMCPARMMAMWDRFTTKLTKIREQLEVDTIPSDESFERGQRLRRTDLVLQIAVLLMCLVSFWSVTFLLMEVTSFFVEMGVYTLMGIIVNAGTVLQYITVLLMVVMYGRSTFNGVRDKYLSYHQQIHKQLLAMKRDDIDSIAKTEELDQENTALRVQGQLATPSDGSDIRVAVRAGRPQWQTSSLLLFLDKRDTPFTPEKFFYDTICLQYCGSPGPLYVALTQALWSFAYILLFLLFVFVVVMAFGDAYSVSSTNQLLATAAGGIVPFLFRYIFKAPDPPSLRTDSVQFQSQFHHAINRYTQNWPVYDLVPTHFQEVNPFSAIVTNNPGVTAKSSQGSCQPRGDEESESSEEEDSAAVHTADYTKRDSDVDDVLDMIIDVSTQGCRSQGSSGMQLGLLSEKSYIHEPSRFNACIYKPCHPNRGQIVEV